MRAGLRLVLIACAVLLAGPGAAQQAPQVGVLQSPILTIERERLFNQSAFGQRVTAEIEAEGAAITAESRQIDAEMEAEEMALTEQRPSLSPEAFRTLADEFNEKVQRLRAEQDEKVRDLGRRVDEAQRRFLVAARPILAAIMRDAGAVVIVERRTVLLSLDAIDVTDLAIARIDAALGDGADSDPAPQPEQRPPEGRPSPTPDE